MVKSYQELGPVDKVKVVPSHNSAWLEMSTSVEVDPNITLRLKVKVCQNYDGLCNNPELLTLQEVTSVQSSVIPLYFLVI